MSLYPASTCQGFYTPFWHNLLHWNFVHNLGALLSAKELLIALMTFGLGLQLSSGTWRPCLPDLFAGVLSAAFAMLTKHSNLRS